MTLGDIIKIYVIDHSMSDFLKNSGLSKAYAYLLIKGKNNAGGEIKPTIDTIQKVANGVGKSFDEVFNMLDMDMVIHVEPKPDHSKLYNEYLNEIMNRKIIAMHLTKDEISLIEKIRKIDPSYMPMVMAAIDTACDVSKGKDNGKN